MKIVEKSKELKILSLMNVQSMFWYQPFKTTHIKLGGAERFKYDDTSKLTIADPELKMKLLTEWMQGYQSSNSSTLSSL